MKTLFRWIFRLLILAIVLVLVLNNMQQVDLNLFSIYHLKTPLIVLLLVFFVIGLIAGFILNMLRGFASRSSVRDLEKEINRLKGIVTRDSNKGA